jgi:hypothetical protein
MQVNSAQDWLTRYKRQVVAKTYHTVPPPQHRRHNSVFLSAEANGATARERFVIPAVSAWGSVPGGATYTSFCCLSNGNTGPPGVFSTTTNQGIVRFNIVPPLSVTATRPIV